MLNIFRLASILKKLQLNIDLIYHIKNFETQSATMLTASSQNNMNFSPIKKSISSATLETSSNLYKEKALLSATLFDLILCQKISSSAHQLQATSIATNFGTDYMSEFKLLLQQQQYSEKIRHQKNQNQQQQQKFVKFYKNSYYNQKYLSHLLNFKDTSCYCYILKYYINNNLFNFNHNLIINRKMSTNNIKQEQNTTSSTTTSSNKHNNDDDNVKNGCSNYNNSSISNGIEETNGEIDNKLNCIKNNEENDDKSCFTSSLADIIQFLELVGGLKHTKRTGWVLRDIKDVESISGHMYRMSMMTFLLNGSEGLNQIRCMELALVHDLAESIVGDLTPFCGVSKEDKKKREMDAMENICNLIKPRGERMWKLFQEYEAAETPESKFVKDLDRLDLVLQAFEYEKRDNCVMKHQEFFDSTEGKFEHPFVQKLINEIYDQRKELADKLGATTEMYQQNQTIEQKQQNGHSSGECPEDLSQKKATTSS